MDTDPRYSNPTWQRMYQLQLSKGFSPEVAASKANANLAFSTMAKDARELAPEPQMDQFRETPATSAEVQRNLPQFSPAPEPIARQASDVSPDNPAIPANPNYQPGMIEKSYSRAGDSFRRLLMPYAPVSVPSESGEYDVMGGKTGMPTGTVTTPAPTKLGGNYNDMDNVMYNPPVQKPSPYAPIGQAGSLPSMARIGGGASPVAANVQDRTVTPRLIAMAGDRIAPYSMQQSPADMRFSTDKAPAAPARPSLPGAGDPLPVHRPGTPNQNLTSDAKPVPEQGFFARNFGQDPYAGKSASQLMTLANQDPDNAVAFFRADKALQKERPDMFQSAPTEKRGGAIKGNSAPGKDAALHKALEIIHHMITRGR